MTFCHIFLVEELGKYVCVKMYGGVGGFNGYQHKKVWILAGAAKCSNDLGEKHESTSPYVLSPCYIFL